jgi:alpha-aminoadipic semialdehyde synthase
MSAVLGIRREDKSIWERRAPVAPHHVRLLQQEGVMTVVQPSSIRVFSDDEYRAAGATVSEDLSPCDLVVAVKEIPTSLLRADQRYMYFSHTIKGQSYNMPMLRQILDLGCTLLDHERVIDDDGRRLVLFGRHAGLAGMIDSLWALGQRLASEGYDTALALIEPAHRYGQLADAADRLRDVCQRLKEEGLPGELGPLVVGFAGYGNVSRGAQEIIDLLEPLWVRPDELAGVTASGLYATVFAEEHFVAPKQPEQPFDLQNYFDNPQQFVGTFERFLPYLTVLVNCIYWEDRYPRLVTVEGLRKLYEAGQPTPRLRVIGDVSCDVAGAVEATVQTTQPDDPVFVFDPVTEQIQMGVEGRGPAVMAVDNLPCELAHESTMSFGDSLTPLLPAAVRADYSRAWDALTLPPPLQRAVIAHQGELTPTYRYLDKYL